MYSGKRGDMETIQGKTSPNAQGTIGCAPSVRVPIVFVGILGDGKKNKYPPKKGPLKTGKFVKSIYSKECRNWHMLASFPGGDFGDSFGVFSFLVASLQHLC